MAARADGVGLEGGGLAAAAAAAAVAVAIVLVGKGGTGEDFLATWGDNDDTLVLLDEMEDERDLRPGVALAPARLFAAAAEDDLGLGERGVRGVPREFLLLRSLFSVIEERSKPITGRAGVAPPPSGGGGRGRRPGVEDGVLVRFLGKGRGGLPLDRAPLMTGRRMVVAGDLTDLRVSLGDLRAFTRVERGVVAASGGVLWESGLSFELRIGRGRREGGRRSGSGWLEVEVGLGW